MNLVRTVIRWWVVFGLLAALALLATAHVWQYLGYAPCHLCLKQRELYWAAVAVALPASLWSLFFRSRGTPRLAAYLLFAIFAAEAIVATFHAGVELKWWAGPATCTGGAITTVSSMDLQALLNGGKSTGPMCDVAVWTWLGVSMAGWNAMVATVLSILSLFASMRRKDERRGG